ncbi:MAG: heparinase II/III family protein, partial [Clostridia bacterium]|nr:heparinase II/III family protein [Clostridia bacterium]
ADPTEGNLSGGFDPGVLNDIQLLALDYRMTGNPYLGYLAIYAIKNALKTTGNWKSLDDYARMYGRVMYDAACVYDWCYDLLSDADKQQIVLGVENKCCRNGRMEIGFPPNDENAVTGHGAEFQLLRDYLSFAIAIYDEYPGWWNYIADRFYDEYVPVRNEFYEAGMYPQGASLYVRLRFASDLYSALLVKTATGVFPYESEANMKQVMRTVYSYELTTSGHKAFASGDDHSNDRAFIDYGRNALLSSYLFDDATMRKLLEYNYWSYSEFHDAYFSFVSSVPEYLICSSTNLTPASDRHEGMPLILYNGGWLGQIIARNRWSSSNAAAVLMKIGCRTSGNHDHADAGQFQIWYKDVMLAGDTGSYDEYGDSHHLRYHQATVAHNCILIDGAGQKQPSEPGSYANWQSDGYLTGEVTGVSYGYDGSTPTYAYVAGNLQPAYSTKADTVNRRMLTVFDTENQDAPMFFFVFDRIKAKSGSYKKTFLLHVPAEPTIAGNRVTVDVGARKLVLQSVLGGDSITKIGGSGHNYDVNGVQYSAGDDGYWGRVEISPTTGNLTNDLLNVIYVCDAANDPDLTATRFYSSETEGVVIGNTAAVFVKSPTRQTASFSFTAPGAGTLNYYVSGISEGDWKVRVGGNTVGTVHASVDGGFVAFRAPVGAVTLVPYDGGELDCDDNLDVDVDDYDAIGFDELPNP